MNFSWLDFLIKYQIPYTEKGPNTGRKYYGITCPFCSDDPSQHMGVGRQHQGYYCLRDNHHKGNTPHRLIMTLLSCSYQEANAIVNQEQSLIPTDEQFMNSIKALLKPPDEPKPKAVLHMPEHFKPICSGLKGMGRHFSTYLQSRGYNYNEIDELCELFDLRYTLIGDWAYRVIFPIYMPEGLMTWTGRAIAKSKIRYKTLSRSDNPPALEATTNLLFNYPKILNSAGDKLFLVEGPFDSIRIAYFGRDLGITATCLFTKNISDQQINLLLKLGHQWREKYLLLDADTGLEKIALLNKLEPLNCKLCHLPFGIKDPAMLSLEQVRELR